MALADAARFSSRRRASEHRPRGACLLRLGSRLYDVTRFVGMHPGGQEALLQRSGCDVQRDMEGPPHRHSENAWRWLQRYYVGQVQEDGAHDAQDLVDWQKPLAWQVGHLGDRYDVWVHQPVERPIRLFECPLLEASTKTSWYVVPVVWMPLVFYMSWFCYSTLAKEETRIHITADLSILVHQYSFPALFLVGMALWSLFEYCLHRFLFHMRPPAHSYCLITIHFLLHGLHHKAPFDNSRLVFPPLAAWPLVAAAYLLLHLLLPEGLSAALFTGVLCGYVFYDMVHYYLHYGAPPRGSVMATLKAYHLKHHFQHQRTGFGITSRFWDHLFHTIIPEEDAEELG